MVINPVGQGNVAAQAATSSPKNSVGSAGAASSTSGATKDSAVISQKARDLAAAKAGKAMQEEASESMSAKLQEASGT